MIPRRPARNTTTSCAHMMFSNEAHAAHQLHLKLDDEPGRSHQFKSCGVRFPHRPAALILKIRLSPDTAFSISHEPSVCAGALVFYIRSCAGNWRRDIDENPKLMLAIVNRLAHTKGWLGHIHSVPFLMGRIGFAEFL